MTQGVDIDRRMLDFLVGLDTEFSDMVDGSHLYFPSKVQLEDVVLPQDQKSLIVETVENFAAYKKVRKLLDLDRSGERSSPSVPCCCLAFVCPGPPRQDCHKVSFLVFSLPAQALMLPVLQQTLLA